MPSETTATECAASPTTIFATASAALAAMPSAAIRRAARMDSIGLLLAEESVHEADEAIHLVGDFRQSHIDVRHAFVVKGHRSIRFHIAFFLEGRFSTQLG